MNEHVEGLNRNQTALFPNTLEEYVEKENPVRFIDAFVDSLNLEKLGFKHSLPNDVGRPSYDPSDHAQALRLRLSEPDQIKQKTRARMPPER
jgi:transposase